MFNNLLNQALSIIPKQSFVYYEFESCEVNELGIKVNVYKEGVEVKDASVQAVRQDMYDKLGLDWSKKYISIHCSLNIRNVDNEQVTPDKVVWNNREYFVSRVTDWYLQDGWKSVIAVENNEEIEQQEDQEEDGSQDQQPEQEEEEKEGGSNDND